MLSPIEFHADILRAAVGGLHERRPAARADDEVALAVLVDREAADPRRQLARYVIIMRLGDQPLGDLAVPVGPRRFEQRLGLGRLGHAGRAVEDEGRGDVRLVHQQLGLQQLELEADRAQIGPKQEVGVLEGELVGLAFGLRRGRHMLGGACVGRGFRENALGRFWVGHRGAA